MKDPRSSHSGETKIDSRHAENCVGTVGFEIDDMLLDEVNQMEAAIRQAKPGHRGVSADAIRVARPLGKALRLLRMKQMVERTNLSRATLYALAHTDPTFPRKIKLTERTVGYIEQEVEQWILSRAQARGVVA
ncbi:helix-turn-helix transcriptional regulator [Burkholderia territorii]|uniref:helix-turn-helix transcriptional regulator n=1 Tax=Burkholderia territorii TaxID=1503055 RepID=UPI000A6EFBA8|nr:AlpA family phage regulatory protein [Burkholderia territorii]